MAAQTNPNDTTGINDTSEFFGGTSPSVSFENEGDRVRGIVTAKELRLATLPDGSIDHWSDGRPKKLAVLTLMTTADGEVNLYVRGYMQANFIETLKAQDLKDVELGALVDVQWTSTDLPTRRGMNGARHFTVTYWSPGKFDAGHIDSAQEPLPTEPPPF